MKKGAYILCILFLACQSLPEEKIATETLAVHLIAETKALLDHGNPLSALQEVSLLERIGKDVVSEEELIELRERSILEIVSIFHASIEREDFTNAYRYFISLLNISEVQRIQGWSPSKLLFKLTHSLAASGEESAALLIALKNLFIINPDEEDMLFLLELSSKTNNRSALKIVTSEMQKLGMSVPKTYAINAPEPIPMNHMTKGTVTVWVDRGIKIKGGVGYPDRVVGSGFFVDRLGYILTNYHLVESEVDPEYEGFSRLYIRLPGQVDEKIPGKVVGYDKVFDLALIKVEVTPEYFFNSAGEPEIEPGAKVFAIGSPAGLEKTVSSGIVSAVERRFLQMGDAMQVDVPLNPGNSGGPLTNENGDLVGIVFAGLEQFESINFAIPINWVNKVLPKLYTPGEVKHPWLGMALHETDQGLQVIYVLPDEPADRAGIREGDIILGMNNEEYKTLRRIQDTLLNFEFPSLVTLEWKSEGHSKNGIVRLDERASYPIDLALERDRRDNILFPLFGMKLKKVGGFLWYTDYVVEKVLQGSIAEESGVERNDPLTIQIWRVEKEKRFAILQVYIKKKKSGFISSVIQLASYLDTDNFV